MFVWKDEKEAEDGPFLRLVNTLSCVYFFSHTLEQAFAQFSAPAKGIES